VPRRFAGTFEDQPLEAIVASSGSCLAIVRHHSASDCLLVPGGCVKRGVLGLVGDVCGGLWAR